MLTGEKILVTGVAGRIGFPITRKLVQEGNEVWGLARFSKPDDRSMLEAMGVRCVVTDLGRDSLDDLPEDFSYVFHAGALLGAPAEQDWQYTFEVNAQGTGRLLKHCRRAKGFVHCSTGSQYKYQGHRPLVEADPPGIHIHNYSLSKIAAEAIVTYVANEWDIPTTIIRICSTYGPMGGAPANRLDALVAGEAIKLHPDKPNPYNPIYEDDQVELGIKAMTVGRTPPLVVNWGGSEMVSAEDYCTYMGNLLGLSPKFEYTNEAYHPLWIDTSYMHEVLGRTKVHWKDGFRRLIRARYPDLSLRDIE